MIPPTPPVPAAGAPAAFLDPIPGIIPFGTVTIFAGAPGVGKTTMLAEWCVRWREGRTICGHPTNTPTEFYYLSADRGWASARQIFSDIGYPDIPQYNPIDDPGFSRKVVQYSNGALDVLRGCIARLAPLPGSHLIIDPLAPFFVPGSSNDPRAVARALWELSCLCRELQITITALAHFSKQPADLMQRYKRPQDRISGSGAWSGFSDTQMYLVDPEPPEQPFHVFGWTPRHHAPQEFKFLRQGSVFVPYHSLSDVGIGRIAIPERAYQLFTLIPDEGCRSADLEQAAKTMFGISRASMFRHLNELEALSVISRPHGWIKRVSLEEVRCIKEGESPSRPQ